MTADVIPSCIKENCTHLVLIKPFFTQLKKREVTFKGFWINGKIFAEAMNPKEITWLLLGETFSKISHHSICYFVRIECSKRIYSGLFEDERNFFIYYFIFMHLFEKHYLGSIYKKYYEQQGLSPCSQCNLMSSRKVSLKNQEKWDSNIEAIKRD